MWWIIGGLIAAYMAVAVLLEEKLHLYDGLGSNFESAGELILWLLFFPGGFTYLLVRHFIDTSRQRRC